MRRKTETRSVSHSCVGHYFKVYPNCSTVLLLFHIPYFSNSKVKVFHILSSGWENTVKYTCDASPFINCSASFSVEILLPWFISASVREFFSLLHSYQFLSVKAKMKLLLFPRVNVLSWCKFHLSMFIYVSFQVKTILEFLTCCIASFSINSDIFDKIFYPLTVA